MNELSITELEINLKTKDGIKKVDMDKETQKVILSLLLNFFKGGIPTKDAK